MKTVEELRAIVESLNIIDDTLFHKVIEDQKACEELLCVFLENDGLKLVKVDAQKFLRNAGTRSVILDALCVDENGKHYSVEMQKSDDDDHQRRVRYIGSNLDTSVTEKGIDFAEIPDVYVIYLSTFDIFRKGRTIYHVDRILRETGEVVQNGFYEIYINAAVDDGSRIAELMQYLAHTKGSNEKFPRLSERVMNLKEKRKGANGMSELLEAYIRERTMEEATESARCFFENGADFELVKKSLKGLPVEELRAIYDEVAGKKN